MNRTALESTRFFLRAGAFLLLSLLVCPALAAQTDGGAPPRAMPLTQFLQEEDWQLQWEPYRQAGVLVREGLRVHLSPRWPWMALNRKEIIYRGRVLRTRRGILYLTSPAIQRLRALPEARQPAEEAPAEEAPAEESPDDEGIQPQDRTETPGAFSREAHPRIKTILLDPGHGGHDPGTIHDWKTAEGSTVTMQEKDIVLDFSRKLEARLKQRFPGRQILMTRREDTYPTLQDRVDIANGVELTEEETMLFLSVHVNASFNPQARGYEVWYLPPDVRRMVMPEDETRDKPRKAVPVLNRLLEEEYSRQSRRLASEILGQLDWKVGDLTENRGMKEESWYVVRKARMPAVLLELGFITHKEEAALLRRESYLKKLVDAVYNGIVRYIEGAEN